MRTAHRHRNEHGGHPWGWYAVLGLALLSLAAVAWTATAWPSAQRAVRTVEPRPVTVLPEPAAGTAEAGGTASNVSPARPHRLDVPALGLHARVVPVDLAAGALVPPDDPAVVGWWRGGAAPGSAAGAVVVTGHTVHDGGGARDDLEQLQRGDRATLPGIGEPVVYRVSRVEVLSKAALADRAPRLFGQRGPARLLLVTCENWNGREYESNVVVTARPSRP